MPEPKKEIPQEDVLGMIEDWFAFLKKDDTQAFFIVTLIITLLFLFGYFEPDQYLDFMKIPVIALFGKKSIQELAKINIRK